MTTEQMRARLCERYPGSAWAKKVQRMPEDQVQAIYLRLERDGELNGPKKKPAHVPASPKKTIFYCSDCQTTFMADNPDTEECRYCGSRRLSKEPPYEQIKKEN